MAWIRVLTYLLCVQLAVAAHGVRTAMAETHRYVMRAGDQALAWTASAGVNSETVLLNGASFGISSAVSPRSVGEVLDRAQRACEQATAGTWRSLWELAVEELPAVLDLPARHHLPIPIVRHADGGGGYVACLLPPPRSSPESLRDWTGRFIAGDHFTTPGPIRFVMARSTDHGSAVVSISTIASIDITEFLSAGRDVPHPPLGFPRPASARVALHAAAASTLRHMTVFELPGRGRGTTAADLLARYTGQLQRQGFETGTPTPDDHGGRTTIATDPAGHSFMVTALASGAGLIVID